MANNSSKSPLPPCPATPNCVRTSSVFDAGTEKVFGILTGIFEEEAHRFEIIDPNRIEIHAVYKIPFVGSKDDLDVILEETDGKTTVFFRSASRIGAYDFGVNKRRVKRILRKLKSKIRD